MNAPVRDLHGMRKKGIRDNESESKSLPEAEDICTREDRTPAMCLARRAALDDDGVMEDAIQFNFHVRVRTSGSTDLENTNRSSRIIGPFD